MPSHLKRTEQYHNIRTIIRCDMFDRDAVNRVTKKIFTSGRIAQLCLQSTFLRVFTQIELQLSKLLSLSRLICVPISKPDLQNSRNCLQCPTAYTALAYIEWHGEGVFETICHYTKTRRNPQNWKFMTCCNASTEVPSNGNGHCK